MVDRVRERWHLDAWDVIRCVEKHSAARLREPMPHLGFFVIVLLFVLTPYTGGCRARLEPASPAGAQALQWPQWPPVVRRFVESEPITAIAYRSPAMWAAGTGGIRRWDVDTQELASIDQESGSWGGRVTALAIDDVGRAWVANEGGIYRVAADRESNLHRGWLWSRTGGVTHVAPIGVDQGGGAWVGTSRGLFRLPDVGGAAIERGHDLAVTSLDLDPDGSSAWVGTRAQGMFRFMEGSARVTVIPGDPGQEIFGSAVLPDGVRLVLGESFGNAWFWLVDPASKVIASGFSGLRHVQPFTRADGHAMLRSGDTAYNISRDACWCRAAQSGHDRPVATLASLDSRLAFVLLPPAPCGIPLPTAHPGANAASYVACPLQLMPPQPLLARTMAVQNDNAVWFGTDDTGVIRVTPSALHRMGGDLADNGGRFTVACADRGRCYVVNGKHAWLFAQGRFRKLPAPAGSGVRLLGVARLSRGELWGIGWRAQGSELVFGSLPLARGEDLGGIRLQVAHRLSLDLAAESPIVSFATVSPIDHIWVGIARRPTASQNDTPVPHVMIDFDPKARLSHRYLPANGVAFDGDDVFVATTAGVSHIDRTKDARSWEGGACNAVARDRAGRLVAATRNGLVDLGDRTRANPTSISELPGRAPGLRGPSYPVVIGKPRALAFDEGGRLWAGTTRGLLAIEGGEITFQANYLEDGPLVGQRARDERWGVDDVSDVVYDGFDRIWALSNNGLIVVDMNAAN
jgi:hypothetical protein